MQERFNLALVPACSEFQLSLVELARRNLKQADGYLLGPQAIPHVTICQFRAEEKRLLTIKAELEIDRTGENIFVQPQLLSFSHFYIKPGNLQHSGKYWVGLAIREREHLTELHLSTAAALQRLTLEVLTVGDYFPHLTLGRMPPGAISLESLPPPESDFFRTAQNFHCKLGLSNENGVLLRVLN